MQIANLIDDRQKLRGPMVYLFGHEMLQACKPS